MKLEKRVVALERHGGLFRRAVQRGQRGTVIEVAHDRANCRVRWDHGRTTTSYPWHIQEIS